MVLVARLGRNVNGIDAQLYDEALVVRRRFLSDLGFPPTAPIVSPSRR